MLNSNMDNKMCVCMQSKYMLNAFKDDFTIEIVETRLLNRKIVFVTNAATCL